VTWAADGYGVDGNRDGILDAEQAQVAGISLVNDGASSSDYGALAVSGDVVLRDVAIQPTASDGTVPVTLADGSTVSAPLPTGISNTFAGSLSFTVSGLTPGGTTEALIYLPVGYSGDGNAYVRYNYNSGRFEEYLDTQGNRLYAFTDTDGDGFGDAITLTLADGDAQWDGDGLANGSVVDPGFLASGAIEITGDGQNNRLSGNILANQIRGKGKRDVLIGDLGDDILRGGKGDDRLNSGEGADILIGGHGADRFRYSALIDSTVERSDTIQFGRRDQIDLRQLDANTTRKGNQAFRFIADVKFSGQAGELRLFESRLLADVDGDRQADFALNLRSNQAFSADVLSL
jgi:Ca2+-binding RTX toxin-like protein